jgi:triosephosphate isomerase
MRSLIVGNWKLYVRNLSDGRKLLKELDKKFPRGVKSDVVVCPPNALGVALREGYGGKRIGFGAQDVFWESEGAYTGMISPVGVAESGIEYTIVGHAERRALGDTNEIVAKKAAAAYSAGLSVILCVGEMERDQDGGHFAHLAKDVTQSIARLDPSSVSRLTIAYEPVWAIGAAEAPHPRVAEESIVYIRKTIANLWGRERALKVRIIYGGAVDSISAPKFAEHRSIQGLLVGRASVNAGEFSKIIKAFSK